MIPVTTEQLMTAADKLLGHYKFDDEGPRQMSPGAVCNKAFVHLRDAVKRIREDEHPIHSRDKRISELEATLKSIVEIGLESKTTPDRALQACTVIAHKGLERP